jgi:hypothetical protein
MLALGAGMALLGGSNLPPGDPLERVRYYTRSIEFDFVEWTLEAAGIKLEQAILGTASYIPRSAWSETVLEYLDLLRQIRQVERQIELIYIDPAVSDPKTASAELHRQLAKLSQQRQALEPVAETILESQLSEVVAEAGLAFGGQLVPPALYHTTPPPNALIISPREVIRQDFNISISPQVPLEEQVELENRVEKNLKVSSLVVGIGGIGLYPTMVMETTDINWLAEVIAHEWIHNYLTFRPLGMNYLTSAELRTMNETVASIAGKEMGFLLVSRFYPESVPPTAPQDAAPASVPAAEPPPFNFRAEMRQTRVWVDRLLLEQRVEEAEAYMEQRRQFFWDNGYRLRKLNQAYFAFYGAYADDPEGGAAGEDPVGMAVRQFRLQSASLREFVNQISWMASFEQLQAAIEE